MMALSLIFGIVLGRIDSNIETLLQVLNILNDIVMKIVSLLLYFMSIGIFSLIIGRVVTIKDFDLLAKQLGLFVLTTNVGLLTHGFLILPLIYYLVTRQNPFIFMRGITDLINKTQNENLSFYRLYN